MSTVFEKFASRVCSSRVILLVCEVGVRLSFLGAIFDGVEHQYYVQCCGQQIMFDGFVGESCCMVWVASRV